jgi:hypothetical protein
MLRIYTCKTIMMKHLVLELIWRMAAARTPQLRTSVMTILLAALPSVSPDSNPLSLSTFPRLGNHIFVQTHPVAQRHPMTIL